jgi:hypothetical protein
MPQALISSNPSHASNGMALWAGVDRRHRDKHAREIVMGGHRASSIAALLLTAVAGCSSSSGGGSAAIIGEWQPAPDSGSNVPGATTYFDSNGTGGDVAPLGGQRVCFETFSYTFDGSTLTTTPTSDGGVIGQPHTAHVSFSGNTMTISYSSPQYLVDAVWSRVNSSGTNTCP